MYNTVQTKKESQNYRWCLLNIPEEKIGSITTLSACYYYDYQEISVHVSLILPVHSQHSVKYMYIVFLNILLSMTNIL